MSVAIDLDGRALAKEARAELKNKVLTFKQAHARVPSLVVVLVGDDPASAVYVRNKEKAALEAGIDARTDRFDALLSQQVLIEHVHKLNQDPDVDGILVQMPLPSQIDASAVINAIDPQKDVDGLHPINLGRLVNADSGLYPCTPLGCMRLIAKTGRALRGARAIVVGRSRLVGKPLAMLLLHQNATVTIAHSATVDLAARVSEADVVVAALGKAAFIRGDWIKPGAIVIDVGINRLADGKLVGDVDYLAARTRASFITPVPGGVGPMTIAMLLENTLSAAQMRARL